MPAGFMILCVAVAAAQGPILAPIPFETVVEGEPQFGSPLGSNEPALSPDGQLLAFTLRDSSRFAVGENALRTARGVSKIHEGSAVWIADATGSSTRRVTPLGVTGWAPAWSPDGQELAFLSDQSGTAGLWVWSGQTRELRQVPGVEPAVNGYGFDYLTWADSRRVLMKIRRDGERAAGAESPALTPSEGARTRPPIDVHDWPPEPLREESRRDDVPSLSPAYREAFAATVAIVEVANGAARRLTDAHAFPGHFALSPDRTQLAISLLRVRGEEQGFSDYEIVVLDLKSGKSVQATSSVRELFAPPPMSWSPDGEYLAYSSLTSGYQNTSEGELFVWSARARLARNVSARTSQGHFGNYSTPAAWGSRHRVYALSARGGGSNVVWEMTANGEAAPRPLELAGITIHRLIPVTTPDGIKPRGAAPHFLAVGSEGAPDRTVTLGYFEDRGWVRLWSGNHDFKASGHHRGFAFAKAQGGVAFVRESASEPPELWYASSFSAEPRKISHFNRELQRYALGEPKLMSFVNGWGERLHAALLLPPDFESGKRYPMVVTGYPNETGGRHITQFGLGIRWGLDGQLLATRGYVVAYVDCPIRVGRNSTMKDIAENFVPAVRSLIDAGIADPGRIAVMGQSRGGYMVMALIAQTDLFSAAISVEPSTVSLPASAGELQLGSVLGGYGQTMWVDGNLWENTQAWIENSPFFYFPKVTTPVLVAAGGDSRAIVGDQIYAGLAQLGKRVSYARYFGEGHVPALWSSSNYRDFLERSIAWLDQYLKPESSGSVSRICCSSSHSTPISHTDNVSFTTASVHLGSAQAANGLTMRMPTTL